MAAYWTKTPEWLKKIYPKRIIWDIQDEGTPVVYLTFDDGPHPEATPFVLQQLEKYNAKATFFCVGNNVNRFPDIYENILGNGHKTGNHTYSHLNGWKTSGRNYLKDFKLAAQLVKTNLFRPPYGRIKLSQVLKLRKINPDIKIILWSVLSGDFDNNISQEECLNNVLRYLKPGCIVIFHDSAKAFPRMSYALPRVLEFCSKNNWQMAAIPF